MKVSTRLTAGFCCALCMSVGASLHAQQQGYPPPPPQQQQNYPQQQPQQGYGQQPQGGNYGPPQQGQNYGPPPQGPGGWDAPPPDFSPIGRQGFQDGIRAARDDARSGRPMFVTQNPFYRHPPVPRPARNEYRDAFQRGYDRVMRHRGEAPPPPQPGQYYPH